MPDRPAEQHELPFTWAQEAALRWEFGLQAEDPLHAGTVLLMLATRDVINQEADRIALGVVDDDDG